MTGKIGILGGISPASTAKYYEHIVSEYFRRFGDYHFPEIVIYSLDFQRFTDLEDARDEEGYVAYIVEGLTRLQAAGVDLAVMAANSPHAAFEKVAGKVSIRLIHIGRIVGDFAVRSGLKKLLLLGIKFTLDSGFYQRVLAEYGLEVVTPSAEHADSVDRIIFDELVISRFSESTRARLIEIGSAYEVDAVILGCTELPLILRQEDAPFRTIDTAALHAHAALDAALSIPQESGAHRDPDRGSLTPSQEGTR